MNLSRSNSSTSNPFAVLERRCPAGKRRPGPASANRLAALFNAAVISALLSLGAGIGWAGAAWAGQVQLAWDAVPDARVTIYEVQVRQASGGPPRSVVRTSTEASITGLTVGETYLFSVRACAAGRTLCSAYSNAISVTLGASGAAPAPRAGFTANRTRGSVPLTVLFKDDSEGRISDRTWSLGDGATSTGIDVVHSYVTPGRYSVALEVSGPTGRDRVLKADLITALPSTSTSERTETRAAPPTASADGDVPIGPGAAALPIETGTVSADHRWQWVPFRQPFTDPVVVAGPVSGNGPDPAVVGIEDVDTNGFWLRVKEWDYLDDRHVPETIDYVVMDRGRYRLPDGTRVEAGHVESAVTGAWSRVRFADEFASTPVVVASVASAGDDRTVIARLHNIDIQGFDLRLFEQEANRPGPRAETVSFIAWEPSVGELDNLDFAVARTARELSDQLYRLELDPALQRSPLFIADIQTTHGRDPASLRWYERSATALTIRITEEQSLDAETDHTAEVLGYILFAD